MKLCTFIKNGEPRVGALTERGIADVTAAAGGCMNALIASGAAGLKAIEAAIPSAELYAEADIEYGNVTRPGKIICVGLNYKSHAEETGGTAPTSPMLFSKFGDALCPSGHDVELPRWQRCFDYEAELVIVVGKPAYNVSEAEAAGCIFGYTCGDDLSARDCQFITSQWLSGKAFPDFAPAGPFIVTAESFDPTRPMGIFCEVNGERVQSGDTSDMIFSCTEIVARASRYFRLAPGDLIFTGTPAGVILGKPKGTRVWLKPGDSVRVTIEGIGTLENRLV